MKKIVTMGMSTAILLGILLFNNCSSRHGGSSALNSLRFGTCSLTGTEMLFSLTYHPFLKQHCTKCHEPGGEGKGYFSAEGTAAAFSSFNAVGFSKISKFAVDQGHKSPYSGSQHKAEISQLKSLWSRGIEEINKCGKKAELTDFIGDPWADERVSTRSQALDPAIFGESVVVRWDLNKDMLPPPEGVDFPSLPGVFFEITVATSINGSETGYLISRPKIVYPVPVAAKEGEGLQIDSLRIKVNGEEVINETTFHYLSAIVRKNQDTILSPGGMLATGSLRTSDVIAVSFGQVKARSNLDPIPELNSVKFVTASTAVNETNVDQIVEISVELDEKPITFATVGLSIDNLPDADPARPRCCSSLVNIEGDSVPIFNFDADYEIPNDSGLTLVFGPNDKVRNVRIRIVGDQRDDADLESLQLSISPGDFFYDGKVGNVVADQSKHLIKITDDDLPPASPEIITFSKLMGPAGVFRTKCAKCHHRNSAGELEREYDMTTYEELLSRSRVVPGDLDASTMWQRLKSVNNELVMPRTGIMSNTLTNKIKRWIENGAKND